MLLVKRKRRQMQGRKAKRRMIHLRVQTKQPPRLVTQTINHLQPRKAKSKQILILGKKRATWIYSQLRRLLRRAKINRWRSVQNPQVQRAIKIIKLLTNQLAIWAKYHLRMVIWWRMGMDRTISKWCYCRLRRTSNTFLKCHRHRF